MISWETVGVSAAITLIFAVAILLVIRKSSKFDTEYMNSISVQNLDKIFDERMERRNENADIRDEIHELVRQIECKYNPKFARLEGEIFEEMQLRIKDDMELNASIDNNRARLDWAVERIDDLAKSVEQPEKKGNEND